MAYYKLLQRDKQGRLRSPFSKGKQRLMYNELGEWTVAEPDPDSTPNWWFGRGGNITVASHLDAIRLHLKPFKNPVSRCELYEVEVAQVKSSADRRRCRIAPFNPRPWEQKYFASAIRLVKRISIPEGWIDPKSGYFYGFHYIDVDGRGGCALISEG